MSKMYITLLSESFSHDVTISLSWYQTMPPMWDLSAR